MLARLGAGRAFGHAFPEVGRVARQPALAKQRKHTRAYSSGTPARASTPRSPDTRSEDQGRIVRRTHSTSTAPRGSRRVASATSVRAPTGRQRRGAPSPAPRTRKTPGAARRAGPSRPSRRAWWPVAPARRRHERAGAAAPPFEQSLERRELGRVAGGRAGRVRVHVVGELRIRASPSAARAARGTPAPSGGGADMCTASPPRP